MKAYVIRTISNNIDSDYVTNGSFDDFGEECSHDLSNGSFRIKRIFLSHMPIVFPGQEAYDTWDLTLENTQLRSENYMLQEKLRSIENRLSIVESHIPEEKVVVLRDISYEDAKEEIKELFHKGRTLFYSDISQELGISLHTVVEICNELHKNGEIAVHA
jgi:hypothetical protein